MHDENVRNNEKQYEQTPTSSNIVKYTTDLVLKWAKPVYVCEYDKNKSAETLLWFGKLIC